MKEGVRNLGFRRRNVQRLTSQMVFGIFNGMKACIPIDKAGRVVLPKGIRDRLHLLAGDLLDIEFAGEEISLRPRRVASARLVTEGKRVVWDAPESTLSADDFQAALQRARRERDQRSSGI